MWKVSRQQSHGDSEKEVQTIADEWESSASLVDPANVPPSPPHLHLHLVFNKIREQPTFEYLHLKKLSGAVLHSAT